MMICRVFVFAFCLGFAQSACNNSIAAGSHVLKTALGEFTLYVPKGLTTTQSVKTLFGFHGYTESMNAWQQYSRGDAACEKHQWLGVWVQGSGPTRGWNAGGCCPGVKRDDISFVKQIINYLDGKMCRDSAHTFAAGFSNGGFFSSRLACDMSDYFRAVAPGSGVMSFSGGAAQSAPGFTKCTPKNHTSILHFHGTSDTTVPYNGNKLDKWPGAEADHEYFKKLYGCTGADVTSKTTASTKCMRAAKCNSGSFVELCTCTGMPHTWSGGTHDSGRKGDIVATDYLFEVFDAIV